jgi:D-alanyl-D-alanine carboxypeptidase/D-alanyl-D-alanine-endopeptidase (penicillin-binding protein 4)
MFRHLTRRHFLSSLAAGAILPAVVGPNAAQAEAPTKSLRPMARPATKRPAPETSENLVRKAGLSGVVSYIAMDMKTGKVVDERHSGARMPPASVAKSLTAIYALDVLGGQHRFTTRVIAAGPIENGILKGDLILAGGGDPTLQTDDLAALAAKVKASGLREVRGSFQVWGGALPFEKVIDASQPDHVGYNPSISGVALNFNRVHFEWKRNGSGWGVTMDARSDRYRPEVSMAKMKIVSRDLPVYTYANQGGRDHWTVASTALGKGGSRWLPVRKPELYIGEVFQTMLRSHGIAVKSPKVRPNLPGGTVVASRQSEDLTEILRGMLKYSTNLTAEMVGMAASAKRLGRPIGMRASASEMSNWAQQKFGADTIKMMDHSGLSDASRMTGRDLARMMLRTHASAGLRPILKTIKMRNSKYKVIPNHPVQVVAKTGTLNFVSTLAGYIQAPGGRDLTFVIFTADVPKRKALTKAERERPRGASKWNRNSRLLQQALMQKWGARRHS